MRYITIIFFSLMFIGCGKDFLDETPNKRTRIPSSLADYAALLDNINAMNAGSVHALGMIGADEYYLTEVQYNTYFGRPELYWQAKAYVWDDVIFTGGDGADWTGGYAKILLCNTVLDGLKKVNVTDQKEYDRVAGTAYFFRALNYYNLAQAFCKPYNAGAAHDLGLPLREDPDVTVHIDRATLSATYEFIFSDLQKAIALLPDVAVTVFRPSKVVVEALKTRIYLQMDAYDKALTAAENVLAVYKELMDFNGKTSTNGFSFAEYGEKNPEVFFYTTTMTPTILLNNAYNIDETLLASYAADDLRKNIYFKTNGSSPLLFMGSYSGSLYYFSGFAVDEILLHQAECLARKGKLELALKSLNRLRSHRIAKQSFTELSSDDPEQIVRWIMEEKKKELVFRGIRWEELRRLNREAKFQQTLYRKLGAVQFSLEPGSTKWTWPLPVEAITLGGYKQNER